MPDILPGKDDEKENHSHHQIPLTQELGDSDLRAKTMSLSIKEGYFGGASQFLSDQFMIPYAHSLQVSPTLLGLFRALLGFLSPVGQTLGSKLMKTHSRRRIVFMGVFIQLLIWPFIMLLGVFAINNFIVSILPFFLVCFYILYSFFGSFTVPSWFSLMGDIVPDDYRGRYFSNRSLRITLISIIISILASILLEQLSFSENIFIGFFIVFFIAFLSKGISTYLLTRHYYPPFKIEKHSYINFKKFSSTILKSNFGLFTLYMTFISLFLNIGAPFIGFYMLDDLKFNYIEYTLVNLSTPFLSIFFYPILGYLSDKYGNALILRTCGFLLPALPILWIFSNTPLQLILGPQLLAAFAWTGVNLAASNFIYDNIPVQQRGFYIAYFNLFLGTGILCGGLLGSFLLQIVPILFISSYETLFLISGITRLFVNFIFLYRIKEVRVKKGEDNNV
jgi:MFS family permease